MGNIGRPSTGCGLCRKRRVKCDEGRPGCRNCARLKKACPGYREPGYGLIRSTVFVPNTNEVTHRTSSSESLPQSTHLRATSTSTEDEESDSAQSDSVLQFNSRLPHRPRSLNIQPDEVTEQAVWYSLKQLDANSRVLYGNPAFNFLPGILSTSGPDSYLYAAMRCVGAVNFANRSPTVDMRSLVEFEYARAVSGVSVALADPDQCLKDETLVAVWLLGIRELLAGVTGSSRASSLQTHIDGTLMLLQLRGDNQFYRPEGRHLFHTLLSAMHWKPLFASEEPTQEYLDLESQIPKATPNVPPASLKLRSFFHGVSKLRARIKNFLRVVEDASIDKPTMVNSYLRAAAKLEDKANGWCDLTSWLPQKVLIDTPSYRYGHRTPWTNGTLFRLHCFKSWTAFFHWNRFLVAKICLHAALLDALATVSKLDTTTTGEGGNATVNDMISFHSGIVHETVREFLGTISYAFGDVDEHGLARAIPTAVVSDGAANEHRGVNVPATLQIQPPLSYLITLKYLAPGQREAMYLALRRLRAEFTLM